MADLVDETRGGVSIPEATGVHASSTSSGTASVAKAVKQSNEEIAKVRKKSKNSLEVMMYIASNTAHVSVYNGIAALVGPPRAKFRLTETKMKTKKGGFELQLEWACGGRLKVVQEMFIILGSASQMRDVGFEAPENTLTDTQQREEVVVATKLVRFTVAFMGKYILNGMAFSHNYPECMEKLISDDPEVVEEALNYCKETWGFFETSTQEALNDVFMHDFLEELMWPTNTWVIENLLALSEFKFKCVPHEVQQS